MLINRNQICCLESGVWEGVLRGCADEKKGPKGRKRVWKNDCYDNSYPDVIVELKFSNPLSRKQSWCAVRCVGLLKMLDMATALQGGLQDVSPLVDSDEPRSWVFPHPFIDIYEEVSHSICRQRPTRSTACAAHKGIENLSTIKATAQPDLHSSNRDFLHQHPSIISRIEMTRCI
jgi:hypothetical protein